MRLSCFLLSLAVLSGCSLVNNKSLLKEAEIIVEEIVIEELERKKK